MLSLSLVCPCFTTMATNSIKQYAVHIPLPHSQLVHSCCWGYKPKATSILILTMCNYSNQLNDRSHRCMRGYFPNWFNRTVLKNGFNIWFTAWTIILLSNSHIRITQKFLSNNLPLFHKTTLFRNKNQFQTSSVTFNPGLKVISPTDSNTRSLTSLKPITYLCQLPYYMTCTYLKVNYSASLHNWLSQQLPYMPTLEPKERPQYT